MTPNSVESHRLTFAPNCSQITSLFVLVVIIYIPVLMLTFITNAGWGWTLNFFTVMCFAGLHEVARELENPFQNVPNDIPLNNFQAQFNEALMNMFVGYHPDAYWRTEDDESVEQDSNRAIPEQQEAAEIQGGSGSEEEGTSDDGAQ